MAANIVSLLKNEYAFSEEIFERKYGPPHGWVGPQPVIGSEIFIGHIPYDINEEVLLPLCKQAGSVFEFILKINKQHPEKNRGYGFVMFTSNEDAAKAIRFLNGFEIQPGRYITAGKSKDIRRLFITGLPEDKTKDEIEAELRSHTNGITKILTVDFFPGYIFVEYEDRPSAQIAFRYLRSAEIFGKKIFTKVAHPEAVSDETNIQQPDAQDLEQDSYNPELPGTSGSGSMPGSSVSVPYDSFFPDTESLTSSSDDENNSPGTNPVNVPVESFFPNTDSLSSSSDEPQTLV